MKKTGFLIISLLLLLSALTVLAQEGGETSLTIMHTSSLYNHIEEFTPFRQPLQGGFPRLATAISEIRAEHPNSLLVSSGRDIMGTPMFSQYGGVISAEMMSLVGYDAALVTSIDLGAGGSIDALVAYNSVANFPILSSNLHLIGFPELSILRNTIIDVDGVSVGIFGLSSEAGGSITNLGDAVELLDTSATIEENLAFFQSQNVDIVVLLSALGLDRDIEIIEQYGGANGIDVVIGNETELLLGEPEDFEAIGRQPYGPYPLVYHEDTEPTLLVYGGKFGSFLGELNLTFDDAGVLQSWGGGLHFMGENVTPDPEVQAYVESLAAGVALDTIVIGEAVEAIPGSFREYPFQETPLANLFADAFLEAGAPYGAQISLVNLGAVWDNLAEGEITVADLTRVQPFFNWLIVMDITGQQLKAALEHGLSQYGGSIEQGGSFPHVAGITYTFDPSRPAGERVTEILFDGAPIDLNATYTIAVNDFMANGGDGYTVLLEGVDRFNTGLTITDILELYITEHSPLELPSMERIQISE